MSITRDQVGVRQADDPGPAKYVRPVFAICLKSLIFFWISDSDAVQKIHQETRSEFSCLGARNKIVRNIFIEEMNKAVPAHWVRKSKQTKQHVCKTEIYLTHPEPEPPRITTTRCGTHCVRKQQNDIVRQREHYSGSSWS